MSIAHHRIPPGNAPTRPSRRMGLASGLAALLLAACGGGSGGGDPPPAPDPVFGSASAYGSEAATPPVGAQVLSVEAFRAWAAGRDLAWVTPGATDQALRAARQRLADDKALVDATIAAHPELARRVQWAAPTDPAVAVQADGTRVWTDPRDPTRTIVFNGPDQAYSDIAASLRHTNARDNLETVYRALHALVPEDRRGVLPDPAALAAVSNADLQAARATVARLAEDYQPGTDTPALPWPADAPASGAALQGRRTALAAAGRAGRLDAFGDITECGEATPPGHGTGVFLSGYYNWSLKQYTTPTRAQGSRGACVAFGTVGGIETWLSRWRSRETNLSEQEVYAQAKYAWWPSADDYGDGLPTVDTVLRMTTTGWRTDNESAWTYNPSRSRVGNDSARRYFFSCKDYAGACSETNHQRPLTCTTAGGNLYCAYPLPASVSNPGGDHQRLTMSASLWDPLAPEDSLAAVRAMLAAGKPVVLSIDVDSWFKLAGDHALSPNDPGVVRYSTGGEIIGGHAILAVGYLPRSVLSEVRAGQLPASSNGYLVLKNSWGCYDGDRGHYYVPDDWVIDHVQGAIVVLGVGSSVTTPEFTLTVDKTLVRDAAELTFKVSGNVTRRRVELYRAGAGSPFHVWSGAAASGTLAVPVASLASPPAFDQGQNWVIARVEDEGGTRIATNWVKFAKDALPPLVTLATSDTTVATGQAFTLTAIASDASGVTKVEFFRGFTRIGERTAAPYTQSYTFAKADVGSWHFVAMATDAAGNKRLAAPIVITSTATLPPRIGHFTATPSSLPVGGGTVTLSWSVSGAGEVSIGPGLGLRPASGSLDTDVAANTVFTLSASNAAGTNSRSAEVMVAQPPPPDTLPPTVSIASASSMNFTAQGTLALTASASDNVAVTRVEWWRGAGKFAEANSPPYAAALPLTAADNGTLAITARAFDAAGNSATSAVLGVTVAIPLPDTTPPAVSLVASSVGVTAPGTMTLTATASDAGGIQRVEFREGGTLLATRNAAPYVLDIGFTSADVGNHTYLATAFDPAGNSASASVTVAVVAPAPADRYVDAAAGADANDGLSPATAFRTLTRAFATVGAGGSVWLADGNYGFAAEGLANRNGSVAVPAGITVRGRSAVGGAVLGFGLRYAAGGGAVDLAFAGASLGDAMSGIVATGGTLTLARLRFVNLGSPASGGGGRNGSAALKIGGATVATLDMTGADLLFGHGVAQAVLITETATLAVTGGRIDQPADCYSSCTSQMTLLDSAQLSFDGLQAPNLTRHSNQLQPAPVVQAFDSSIVTLRNSTLAMPVTAAGFPRTLVQLDQAASVRLVDTTVGALFANIAFARNGTPRIELDGLVSSASVVATVAGAGSTAQPTIVVRRSTLGAFADASAIVALNGSGAVEVRDSRFTGARVALWMQSGTHQVVVRNTDFEGSGLCGRPGCAALRLDGAAASSYDLGTLASPGGNRFASPVTSTGVAIGGGGATVHASGNTWLASTQGSDGAGRYALGAGPCGDASCVVTGGSGANYHVGAGALRLAGN